MIHPPNLHNSRAKRARDLSCYTITGISTGCAAIRGTGSMKKCHHLGDGVIISEMLPFAV